MACVLMAIRFIIYASPRWPGRLFAATSIPLVMLMTIYLADAAPSLMWPGIIVLVVMALLGMPIFALLGGILVLGLALALSTDSLFS